MRLRLGACARAYLLAHARTCDKHTYVRACVLACARALRACVQALRECVHCVHCVHSVHCVRALRA